MKKITIVAAVLCCLCADAKAQASSSANQNVALALSNAIAVSFVSTNNSTGNTVNIPFSTVSDYVNGITTAEQQLKVQSNKNFNISVQSNAVNFSYSGTTTPAPTMQVSNVLQFLVSTNNTGGSLSYQGYSSMPSGTATIINWGSPGGNQTFGITYKANPGFSFPAGTYTTNIIFTATQP